MALDPAFMDRKIEEHLGFEARDDIDGVLSTLAPDCAHDIVGFPGGPSHGREKARKFYEAMFNDLADSRTENIRRLYGDGFMVDETLWSGRAVGNPFGLEGKGRPLSFRMLHVLEFSDEGAIKREQVWFDFPAILAQLPGD